MKGFLKSIAKNGESVVVVAPSFLTDCLETSWEIGISFKEMFESEGGKKFDWVPSLNAQKDWAENLKNIIISAVHDFPDRCHAIKM